ncbi:MAG: CDP-alcohol phosphatidyltransferase family protein [Alphaproteobacteria bacterium]
MLDSHIKPAIDPIIDKLGAGLARIGATADVVTVVGFVIGIGACIALAFQLYWVALALLLLNRIFDGLDGAVARHLGSTDFGGYLDITLDFFFYSGFVFAFAIGHPDQALVAAFLIFSFIGSGSSFLAYAIVAAKLGLSTDARGKKSFYYAGGLAEGTETIVSFVLICLFPAWFFWIAVIFGSMCWITAISRLFIARDQFKPASDLDKTEAD